MASITWTDVTDFAAELSTVSANARTMILAHVNLALDVDLLDGEAGARTKLARVALAAHFGTVPSAGAAGSAGPVTAESAGGLMRQYAQISSAIASGEFSTTAYGVLFLSLIRGSKARVPLVL